MVKTGDVRFAGTDANVFIQMSGPKGVTPKLKLDDAKNNFERNMVDTFDVSLKNELYLLMKHIKQLVFIIALLWKSGAILDLPCPSAILWFCDSVILS